MPWSVIGATLLALVVVFGAFGAHLLRGHLDAYATDVYGRAVFYQAVHALGLLILGVAARVGIVSQPCATIAGWLLLVGIVLFSGSLYAIALTGVKTFGAITPFGGVAFIAGWIAVAIAFARANAS